MFDTILTYVLNYGPVVLAVLGGLTLAVAALAPATKTDLDDKLLTVLRKVHDLLVKFVPNAASAPRTVNSVRDQRTK